MTFIEAPEPTEAAQKMFDEDLAEDGFVMNVTRLWAHEPDVYHGLFGLMRTLAGAHQLSVRERGVLVAAFASTFGDAYCSLAWGAKLAEAADAETAAAVLRGDDGLLTPAEQALAVWARKLAAAPTGTTQPDVQLLRDAGWTDPQIFAVTAFVALRAAFSTVNNALGAHPDAAFRTVAPAPVRSAVNYGRPIEKG